MELAAELWGFPRTFLQAQGVQAADESFMNKHGSSTGLLKGGQDLGSIQGPLPLTKAWLTRVTSCVTLDKSRNHSMQPNFLIKANMYAEQNLPLSCPHVRVALCRHRQVCSKLCRSTENHLHQAGAPIDSSHQHMGSPTFGGLPQTLQASIAQLGVPGRGSYTRPWGSTCCYRVLRGIILPTPPPEPAWEGVQPAQGGRAQVCHPLKIIPLILKTIGYAPTPFTLGLTAT